MALYVFYIKYLLFIIKSSSNRLLMNLTGASGILASQSRINKLNKVAEMYLKSGNITKYCDIMIELNQVGFSRYILIIQLLSLVNFHLYKNYLPKLFLFCIKSSLLL